MLGNCVYVVYLQVVSIFFVKQKTAYEMRISDWSSDVCSSDLAVGFAGCAPRFVPNRGHPALTPDASGPLGPACFACPKDDSVQWAGCGRSCCSLHRITAFSPSRAARAMHAGVLAAVCDP